MTNERDERIIHDVVARGLEKQAIMICVDKGRMIQVYLTPGHGGIDFDMIVRCIKANGNLEVVHSAKGNLWCANVVSITGETSDTPTDWVSIDTPFGKVSASWEWSGYNRDYNKYEVRLNA